MLNGGLRLAVTRSLYNINIQNILTMRYIKGLLAAGLILLFMFGILGMINSNMSNNGMISLANALVVVISVACFTWLLVAEGRKPNS